AFCRRKRGAVSKKSLATFSNGSISSVTPRHVIVIARDRAYRGRHRRSRRRRTLSPDRLFRRAQLVLQPPQHQVIEALEQRLEIVRPRARLGMPLEAERRLVLVREALQRL